MLETLTLAACGRFLLGLVTKPARFAIDVLHAATHEGAYRQQIRDRDEWLASLKTNMTATHAAEKERMLAEFNRVFDEQVQVTQHALTALEQVAAERAAHQAATEAARERWNVTMADLLDATVMLAIAMMFESREHRQEMLEGVRPSVAKATEAIVRQLETNPTPDFAAIQIEALRALMPPGPGGLKALMTDSDR